MAICHGRDPRCCRSRLVGQHLRGRGSLMATTYRRHFCPKGTGVFGQRVEIVVVYTNSEKVYGDLVNQISWIKRVLDEVGAYSSQGHEAEGAQVGQDGFNSTHDSDLSLEVYGEIQREERVTRKVRETWPLLLALKYLVAGVLTWAVAALMLSLVRLTHILLSSGC